MTGPIDVADGNVSGRQLLDLQEAWPILAVWHRLDAVEGRARLRGRQHGSATLGAADEVRADSKRTSVRQRHPVLGLVFLASAESRFEAIRQEVAGGPTAQAGRQMVIVYSSQ